MHHARAINIEREVGEGGKSPDSSGPWPISTNHRHVNYRLERRRRSLNRGAAAEKKTEKTKKKRLHVASINCAGVRVPSQVRAQRSFSHAQKKIKSRLMRRGACASTDECGSDLAALVMTQEYRISWALARVGQVC